MNTDELIQQLSNETAPAQPLPSVVALWAISLGASLAYGAALLMILGVRDDLEQFLMYPYSFIELWLLIALLASSLWSAVCHVYPDQCGAPLFEPLPYIFAALLILIIYAQIDTMDTEKMMEDLSYHIHCLSCIAAASIVPSIGLFLLTQRGATTSPLKSGILITFAAVSVGCIALRLSEASYDMAHILISHYIPIFLFAAIGAQVGRLILKW